MPLNALRREQEALEKSPVNAAAKQAMDQIDRIREQSDGASLEGLKLAHA
jgi:glucitol operon activator protein